jgi:hypothetical protein
MLNLRLGPQKETSALKKGRDSANVTTLKLEPFRNEDSTYGSDSDTAPSWNGRLLVMRQPGGHQGVAISPPRAMVVYCQGALTAKRSPKYTPHDHSII